jgi:hypothetical protein
LHDIFLFAYNNFKGREVGAVLEKLIPVLREDTIDGLRESYKKAEDDVCKAGLGFIRALDSHYRSTIKYRLILMINDGMSYQEAIAQIIAQEYMRRFKERKADNEEAKRSVAKIDRAQTLAKPFFAIGAAVMAIVNAVISFKRFSVDVMAQMCPHITESKVFTINLEDEQKQ